MRIAFRIRALGLMTVSLPLIWSGTATAGAADLPPPPPPPAIAAPSVAAPAAANTVSNPVAGNSSETKTQTAAASNDPLPPLPATPAAASKPVSTAASMNALEDKVPEAVKDVMKHLDKTTGDVTLDDLNTARQAVAKIDILIEIEKRLVELEKVRHERERESGGGLAAMIPASALQQQPQFTPPPQPVGMMANNNPVPPAMMMPHSPYEISRIVGGSGHYSAVLKTGNGDETKTVHVGDKMADGSSVVDITPMQVVLERGEDRHVLHIKNVDNVFGNSL